jgi:hypothetical protein
MPDNDPRATGAPEGGGPQDSAPQETKTPRQEPQEGLTDYWDDILGPRPETIEQRLVRELGLPHPGTFTLATSKGRKIVSIDPNGRVEYGEGYTPDAAAEEFWTNMALKRRGMEQRLQHLAIMEAMLVRMGRADLNYERAQLAAQAQGAGDHERAVGERAHMGLQAIVHQLMDFARGLAQRGPTPAQTDPSPWRREPVPQPPPRPVLPPPERQGDPSCRTCHGEGRILGDCGDSPNVWFDHCPTCRPDPNCTTCRGRGIIEHDGGSPLESWVAPCPTCRPPVDRELTED